MGRIIFWGLVLAGIMSIFVDDSDTIIHKVEKTVTNKVVPTIQTEMLLKLDSLKYELEKYVAEEKENKKKETKTVVNVLEPKKENNKTPKTYPPFLDNIPLGNQNKHF
jgi:hypothetical protein